MQMRTFLIRVKGAKTTHKLVLPPTAAGSVALTYYLVNLVKASLDSSSASQAPIVVEELVHPTEATPAQAPSEGTVDQPTNESESGSSTVVQGNQGTDNETQAQQQAKEPQTAPESPEAPSTQPVSVENPYTNPVTTEERPKEKQPEQKRDSGASQSGDGTPEGEQKPIDLMTQIPLLIEYLDRNQNIWIIPMDGTDVGLDYLNLQKYIVERGTPLLKAVRIHKPQSTSKS